MACSALAIAAHFSLWRLRRSLRRRDEETFPGRSFEVALRPPNAAGERRPGKLFAELTMCRNLQSRTLQSVPNLHRGGVGRSRVTVQNRAGVDPFILVPFAPHSAVTAPLTRLPFGFGLTTVLE